MTNLEYIKKASEKELAELLAHDVGHGDCHDCPNMWRCGDCKSAWLAWLHDDFEVKDHCEDCDNFRFDGTCRERALPKENRCPKFKAKSRG